MFGSVPIYTKKDFDWFRSPNPNNLQVLNIQLYFFLCRYGQ